MDLASLSKSFTESLSEGVLANLFTNPIYVSLLITTTIVLIVICMYNESKLVKTSFYIFCTCMFIVFIHNKMLLIAHRKQLCSNDTENIVNSIDQTVGRYEPSGSSPNTTSNLSYLTI